MFCIVCGIVLTWLQGCHFSAHPVGLPIDLRYSWQQNVHQQHTTARIVVPSFLNLEFHSSNVLSINVLPTYIVQQTAKEIKILITINNIWFDASHRSVAHPLLLLNAWFYSWSIYHSFPQYLTHQRNTAIMLRLATHTNDVPVFCSPAFSTPANLVPRFPVLRFQCPRHQ